MDQGGGDGSKNTTSWCTKDERIKDLCVCVCEFRWKERERIDPENAPNAQNFFFFWNSRRWEGIYSEFVMFCLVHTGSFCQCQQACLFLQLFRFQLQSLIWRPSQTTIDFILVALERYGCLVSKSLWFLKIKRSYQNLWPLELSWCT